MMNVFSQNEEGDYPFEITKKIMVANAGGFHDVKETVQIKGVLETPFGHIQGQNIEFSVRVDELLLEGQPVEVLNEKTLDSALADLGDVSVLPLAPEETVNALKAIGWDAPELTQKAMGFLDAHPNNFG